MFQMIDRRLLRMASRIEGTGAFDPAAAHGRKAQALPYAERRACRTLRLGRSRAWSAGPGCC